MLCLSGFELSCRCVPLRRQPCCTDTVYLRSAVSIGLYIYDWISYRWKRNRNEDEPFKSSVYSVYLKFSRSFPLNVTSLKWSPLITFDDFREPHPAMSSFSKQIWVVPPLNPYLVFSDPPFWVLSYDWSPLNNDRSLLLDVMLGRHICCCYMKTCFFAYVKFHCKEGLTPNWQYW